MTSRQTGRLRGKRLTLGVTGSIAAFKAVAVARLLVKEGARVRVVLTAGATRFVGASTFSGVTGEPALTDMFDETTGGERHVALAAESDLFLVVPATADAIARFASGRADDLLTATALCAQCPVLVAPAMHPSMWTHPATARNVATLTADGRVALVGPVHGEVASGDLGEGRMAEPEDIVARVVAALLEHDFEGRHLVVTAGPTVEDIDPVRFVGNRSSGKMGFALAECARSRGARVTLIAGPVSLPTPSGVTRVDVRSALQMQAATEAALGSALEAADALLMCAAVSDYRAKSESSSKLKRGKKSALSIELVQNPDILAEIGHARRGVRPVLVGFALETGTDRDIVSYARGKLQAKRVDIVVANHAAESMGREDNRVLLVSRELVDALPALPKRAVAGRILDWLARRLSETEGSARPKDKAQKARAKARR
jgi:phosphopantothenoylcysteine decarboxylase/phosphopantothenate--cysteine ligase